MFAAANPAAMPPTEDRTDAVARLAGLLDLPVVEQNDAVCQGEGFFLVVGDINGWNLGGMQ